MTANSPSHFLRHERVGTDVRKKQREARPLQPWLYCARRPLPSPTLQRLTDTIKWNRETASRNRLS